MSETDAILRDPSTDAAVSLEERMRAASTEREEATTEDFPVPGWASTTWVRLKVLSHKVQRAQVEKNRRVRDKATIELYVAADTILAATDGFYEVLPAHDGEDEQLRPVATDWRRLGIAVKDMGQETTPRQALIRLVGNERIVPFYGEYIEWLQGERERIRGEQSEDFRTTA